MTIIVTIRWLMDNSLWMSFCKVTGVDSYALEYSSEGTEFYLTEEQAKEIGINISY